MIQEIAPHIFDNTYTPKKAERKDYVIYCANNQIALWKEGESYRIPKIEELDEKGIQLDGIGLATYIQKEYAEEKLQFLFTMDEDAFYLLKEKAETVQEKIQKIPGIVFCKGEVFREISPMHMAFAGITGMQLSRFAEAHQYCGRCGSKMIHSEKERAYICESCGRIAYPKISPAIIVAIIDRERDKILLTRYAYGEYKKYALVAGFVEVGESFEETVHREVMEEVGLKVKNVTYYKSQPWSFSDTIMVGFFAELDGDNTIVRQEEELAEAVWMSREEMTDSGRNISIGHEMMEAFRKDQWKSVL